MCLLFTADSITHAKNVKQPRLAAFHVTLLYQMFRAFFHSAFRLRVDVLKLSLLREDRLVFHFSLFIHKKNNQSLE